MVVWKERKHELDDAMAGNDPSVVASLWGCGLLKIVNVSSMRSHVRLLEYILRM